MRTVSRRDGAVALGLFALLLIHGATIGMTDDEAYYWVLAQRPALGYAFHPPMVAWVIAAVQALFGGAAHSFAARVLVVRLPSAAGTALILWLALRWLARAGEEASPAGRDTEAGHGLRAPALLLSFAGLFALGWMMVPDIPLFVGWSLAFAATWEIAFSARPRARDYLALAAGTACAELSKYSAVLAAPSVLACLFFGVGAGGTGVPHDRRWNGTAALILGGAIAAAPILAWNADHGWASILYQIRDRHGASDLSLRRYLRFWLIELAVAGPILIGFFFWLLGQARPRSLVCSGPGRVYAFCAVWAIPAALVFGLQPLFFGDFKPHWIFIAWWPAMLALAYAATRDPRPPGLASRWAVRVQIVYGLLLGALVITACHLPIMGWVRGGTGDPRLDVTNDLYGWQDFGPWLEAQPVPALPVVGARYQTASQAAFALGVPGRVTLIPRDLKARDEWPELGVTDGVGPDWPHLTAPVLFVADNRYDAGPDFPGADCQKLGRLQTERAGMVAKSIYAWRCAPAAAQP